MFRNGHRLQKQDRRSKTLSYQDLYILLYNLYPLHTILCQYRQAGDRYCFYILRFANNYKLIYVYIITHFWHCDVAFFAAFYVAHSVVQNVVDIIFYKTKKTTEYSVVVVIMGITQQVN